MSYSDTKSTGQTVRSLSHNPVLGAIIGDMIGSPYEFGSVSPTQAETMLLWSEESSYTDDTMLTLAVYDAIESNKLNFAEQYIEAARAEPIQSWGAGFRDWADDGDPSVQRDSLGNGVVMRLSPVAYLGQMQGLDISEILQLAEKSCHGSHDHPISYAAARCYTKALYGLLQGESPERSYQYLNDEGFQCDGLDELRKSYRYSERVDKTLAESYICFLEADSYEQTMRNVLSLQGDADTMCAVAGAFAAVAYEIPQYLINRACRLMESPNSDFVSKRWKRSISRYIARNK